MANVVNKPNYSLDELRYSVTEFGKTLFIRQKEPYKNIRAINDGMAIVTLDNGTTVSGNVGGAVGTKILYGNDETLFLSELEEGQKIYLNNRFKYKIESIQDDRILHLTAKLQEDISQGSITFAESDDTYFEKFFRYSSDNNNFSEFLPFDTYNLTNVNIDNLKDFYIEYKFTPIDNSVDGVSKGLNLLTIALEVEKTSGLLSYVPQAQFSKDFSDPGVYPNLIVEEANESDIFKPYELGQVNKVYEQLVDVTSNIFGHGVQYFRVAPDQRSKDVILNEYSLGSVVAMGKLKIMVPDNEFPTQELQYNPFGVFFDDFEIHVTRKAFQDEFGVGTEPKADDYMYLENFNRIYQVNSVVMADEFNLQHTYFRVLLSKWENKASIQGTPVTDAAVEDLIVDTNSLFGEEIKEETEKVTKPLQYKTISQGKDDFIRSDINESVDIIDYEINNSWTVVSKNYYNLSGVAKDSIAIQYRASAAQAADENRAYSFWFQSNLFQEKANPTTFALNANGYVVINTNLVDKQYKVGDWVEITNAADMPSFNNAYRIAKANSLTQYVLDFTATEVPITGDAAYKEAANIFGSDLTEETKGVSIGLINNFIIYKVNGIWYTCPTGENYQPGEWYGLVLNHNNIDLQLGSYIYKLNNQVDDNSFYQDNTQLEEISRHVQTLNGAYECPDDQFALRGCNMNITNVRVYDTTLSEEQHSNILNQYVVRDSDKAILIDNALPQVKLMRLANNR